MDEEEEDVDVDDDAEARCKCTICTMYSVLSPFKSGFLRKSSTDARACLEAALGKVDALVDGDDDDLVALQSHLE